MFRSASTIASTLPASSMMTSASGRSKSIDPRRFRRAFSTWNSSPMSWNFGIEIAVLAHQLGWPGRQDGVHIRVGHPRRGVDDTVVKLVPDHRPVGVDFHQTGLHQPIDPRVQAADAGRQLRWKHVDRAIGEIHRRGALVALPRRARCPRSRSAPRLRCARRASSGRSPASRC